MEKKEQRKWTLRTLKRFILRMVSSLSRDPWLNKLLQIRGSPKGQTSYLCLYVVFGRLFPPYGGSRNPLLTNRAQKSRGRKQIENDRAKFVCPGKSTYWRLRPRTLRELIAFFWTKTGRDLLLLLADTRKIRVFRLTHIVNEQGVPEKATLDEIFMPDN